MLIRVEGLVGGIPPGRPDIMRRVELADLSMVLVRGIAPASGRKLEQLRNRDNAEKFRSLVLEIPSQAVIVISGDPILFLRSQTVDLIQPPA